jgi:hypothetical protein
MNTVRKEAKGANSLYDTDFHAWAWEQARKLRAGEPIDTENVAEELETLGRSEQQQLESRLAVLLAHMLKSEFQPEKRTASWTGTIKEQRRRVNRLLAKMPSLQATLQEAITEGYVTAIILASTETGIVEDDFPSECPYTVEQILEG